MLICWDIPPYLVFYFKKSIIKSNHWRSELITMYAAAKLLQICPTLCGPTDSSPPGPSIPGILQARTLEWVSISFSNTVLLMTTVIVLYLHATSKILV